MTIKKISSYYKAELILIDKIIDKFLKSLTSKEKMELLDIKSILLSAAAELKKAKILDKINNLSKKLNPSNTLSHIENILKTLNSIAYKK